jgi:2-keto-4-pentenoate hydratase/2-oxohepta-3-ene-1,7-dioic acid hydratase in catechol pathway
MRLVTFQSPTGQRLGVKTEHGVIDVVAASQQLLPDTPIFLPTSMEELCAEGEKALQAMSQLVEIANQQQESTPWLLNEETLQFGPCVSRLGKIICVGLNYRRHAAESGMVVPTSPVLFPKYANSLAGSGEPVPLPGNAVQYDYEAELAVVIGQRVKAIREDEALACVLGYCNANDLSARDLQFRTNQWLLGKALDKFLPIGPYLVTTDEIADPQVLHMRCLVNGEERQNSSTADMVFSVAFIVSYLSQYMTLEPGDIILTGTPEGVIFGKENGKWLTAGDEVVIEIEGLGRLANVMQ